MISSICFAMAIMGTLKSFTIKVKPEITWKCKEAFKDLEKITVSNIDIF